MRNKLLLLAVGVLMNSCVASSGHWNQGKALDSPADQRSPMRVAKREEVPFAYDSSDFFKVEVKTEPKAIATEGVEGFPVEAPTHSCFYLQDKRSLPALEKGARYFYPAHSFVCIIPLTDLSTRNFTQAYPYLSEAAVKLRKLLMGRPSKFKSSDDINDLPFNNAGGVIESKVEYLEFKTGSGVLFLTQYSQEMLPNPVNNEELTCNFQGLTTNGKYYVAARLAITHPTLPRGIDFTEHSERDEKWNYLRLDETRLNGLAEESFQPSLKTLKALISSISIQ